MAKKKGFRKEHIQTDAGSSVVSDLVATEPKAETPKVEEKPKAEKPKEEKPKAEEPKAEKPAKPVTKKATKKEGVLMLDNVQASPKMGFTTQLREEVQYALDRYVYTMKYTGHPGYSISQAIEDALVDKLHGQKVIPLPEELQRKPYVVSFDKDIGNFKVYDKAKRKALYIGEKDACEDWAKDHYN